METLMILFGEIIAICWRPQAAQQAVHSFLEIATIREDDRPQQAVEIMRIRLIKTDGKYLVPLCVVHQEIIEFLLHPSG